MVFLMFLTVVHEVVLHLVFRNCQIYIYICIYTVILLKRLKKTVTKFCLLCCSYMDMEQYEEAVRDYEKVYQTEKTKGENMNVPFTLGCVSICSCCSVRRHS